RKQPGEPPRVQPSRARPVVGSRRLPVASGSSRKSRIPAHPLIEIARAWRKDDALAGLERWKRRHPEAAGYLQPADVLVDSMRGRSSTWTRIRINLQHVPDALRPAPEKPDPDELPPFRPRTPSPARTRA